MRCATAGRCRSARRPVLLPVETALGTAAQSHLALISAARAATLKLANQREAADPHAPVLIRAAEPIDLAAARPIADPAIDLEAPLKGPFRAELAALARRGRSGDGTGAARRHPARVPRRAQRPPNRRSQWLWKTSPPGAIPRG